MPKKTPTVFDVYPIRRPRRRGLIQQVNGTLSSVAGKFLAFLGIKATTPAPAPRRNYSSLATKRREATSRTAIHRDAERMDADDEFVREALDKLSDEATMLEDPEAEFFSLETDDKEVASTLEDLCVRCNISVKPGRRNPMADDCTPRSVARSLAKFGNVVREILMDGREVVNLRDLPEHTMWPNLAENGQRAPGWRQEVLGKQPVLYEEWQILPFAFGERWGGGLGTSLLKAARKNWTRLQSLEDDIAQTRKARGSGRYLHRVPVEEGMSVEEQQQAVQAYIEATKQEWVYNSADDDLVRQSKPDTPSVDYYLADDGTGKGGITTLEFGLQGLSNIGDIEYFLRRLLAALKVPANRLNVDLSKVARLSEGNQEQQERSWDRTLLNMQKELRDGYTRLFNFQLFLVGIPETRWDYALRFPDVSAGRLEEMVKTAQTIAQTLQVLATAYQFPLLPQTLEPILRNLGLSQQDIEVVLKEVKGAKAVEAKPPTPGPAQQGKKNGHKIPGGILLPEGLEVVKL